MPVPLPLAVPAAAAGLAYLNAKYSLWYDAHMLNAVIPPVIKMFIRKRKGQLSGFYAIEERAMSKDTANHTFLLFEDRSYTYAQTYELVLRYGHWWREKVGIKEGQTVAFDFMNSDTFIFLWLGLWAVGAKVAFINYNLREKALLHCVNRAQASFFLIDGRVAEALTDDVRAELAPMRCEIFTPELRAEAEAMEPVRFPDELRYDDKLEGMAGLIYTSGTTGLPKAAVTSWGKYIIGGSVWARWAGVKSTDVYYTCMPLYHSSASVLCVFNAISVGATVALGVKFSTKTFWSDVRRYNATVIQYVGETCRYLLAAPPEIDPVTGECLDLKNNVRVAIGNGLRPDIWNKFKERFGIETIAEFFAATEGAHGTFNLSKNDFTLGAVGRSGVGYKYVRGDDAVLIEVDYETNELRRDPKTGLCRRAAVGEPGESLWNLPSGDTNTRYQGYWGDQAATDSKVVHDVLKKGDAWFRTGDIMMKDNDRRLYFLDRLGDTFRWKSENVSTTEVAQAISQHPSVDEANVYGVELPHHDGRAGCAALALTEAREGATTPSPEVLRSLAELARKNLPRYAVPLFLRIVGGSDMRETYATGTNKQQKHVLRTQGVAPDKVQGDLIYWLQGGTYVPFGAKEWQEMTGGRVKL